MSGLNTGGLLNTGAVTFKDSPAIDSFGRLRVSNPYTLFDFKPLYDKGPLVFDEVIFGTATSVWTESNPSIDLSVTNNNDYVVRETKFAFNYQPGKGMAYVLTASQFNTQTNVLKRLGPLHSHFAAPHNVVNGMFFESNGIDGYVSVNIVSNGATVSVPQNSWNLDKMDGSGPSQLIIDWSKCQIFHIDFQWLGVGRVRFGLNLGGKLIYVHEFNHANDSNRPYTSSPNLSVHYSIRSNGGAGSLSTICSAVLLEDGNEINGKTRSISVGTTPVSATASGTTYAILGIRLNSASHDASVFIEHASVLITTNDSFRYSLCINPTIAGTFNFTTLTNSVVQTAIGATANTVSNNGIIIDEQYGSQSSSISESTISNALRIGHTIAGLMDTLVITVTPLANNVSVFATLTWRELI